jgi:hypothetical protein
LPEAEAQKHLIYKLKPRAPTPSFNPLNEEVVIRVFINETGIVQFVRAISGRQPLAQAAMNSIVHWRYKPFLLDGHSTKVDTMVTVRF